ncbi:arginine N-succinyltransferase [Brevundimonas vesicularis]|uniref:Arginine N-succinyltransferase n=1 Tax=Brevundimonas vesicularis TaxID=41276 RepID=A0A1Z3U5D6_BREVE|nr:arginine N-succinyltransferase [Brevundimonas vesicularis]ASE38496.1 arginine N-succinyltransferase [Brevundimonas vesicularis]MDX2333517.1 arginine N-succinyltransferase [Brevundimonas vesicularis]
MLVVRPAGPADLDHLLELAILSGPGFTSLPEDPDALADRLELSQASFEGRVPWQEAWYTLMLEDGDTGDIDGVGSVKATVGLKRPFFSFRVVNNTVQSPSLGVKLDHQTLVLVNECTGWTEVGSLFLKADRRKGGAGRLLSQSRYMLIGAQPELFADNVLAELRGVFTPDGACPFWDHVAHKFFPMEFDHADRMTGSTDKQFILDLAPRHPIYTELLPEPARAVIGKVHPQGVPAMALLESEGFRPNGLVDIFDAGPTVACGRDNIRTVRDARRLTAQIVEGVEAELPALISTDSVAAFRAVRAKADIDGDAVRLNAETAAVLKVRGGDTVRVKS